MSSIAALSINRCIAMTALTIFSAPLSAQDAIGPVDDRADKPEVIDLLVKAREREVDQRRIEQCEREQEAATISREIVVCREIVDDSDRFTTGDRERTQQRYAEETMFAGDLLSPDVAGPGIFKGPATVGSLCIPGLQKCPPPPALMIDLSALPEAPAGSDADRIARGLPPLGRDTAIKQPDPAEAAEISPAGSAAPGVGP
ncbi:hypothetical protein G6N82_09660 [Altererythrobacter sp. BO-6]|uniref:hypothetical protein n=1 Tax=Altererythrobacter sp. BO-6 TaxID=2604537 RepID=UPI0013E0ECD3|nr:hypothetical protein [Altererythrobacter sp. BO-6]QIG54374.1 hypothetical protein G6N82_09660 [Altererythrobacter sp. BO-6]